MRMQNSFGAVLCLFVFIKEFRVSIASNGVCYLRYPFKDKLFGIEGVGFKVNTHLTLSIVTAIRNFHLKVLVKGKLYSILLRDLSS
ncbi:hypothetical protein BKA65DRAFT_56247 [Rhexocercosporidium sp. MPI-PUGE-AT-0058]|nr:hypothetical protein BKA65DRAFT_56247 [Rhexocercosporidium sp. MPI-PUGE-AT-0058]